MARDNTQLISRPLQLFLFLFGIFLSAWAFVALLITNQVLTGGLPGVALILHLALGWNIGLTLWSIGLAILLLGWCLIGRGPALNALAGSLLLPAAIELCKRLNFSLPCEEPLLAAVFGGLLIGLGLGCVFHANASVGGFSLLGRILQRHASIPMARSMLLFDLAVLLTAIALFGYEPAFLAILTAVAMSKGIDLVQTGLGSTKSVTIITSHSAAMKQTLFERVDCGITQLTAEGGHTGEPRDVLVCVIPVTKLARLKRNIQRVDPQAFTIITDATEVLGYGF